MLMARALQLFMPGRPQVWYLDLFAGTNDYEAVRRAGPGGHKEINRSSLALSDAEARLERPVVRDQIALLRMRNASPVFTEDAAVSFLTDGSVLEIRWTNDAGTASLRADFAACGFDVRVQDAEGSETFRYVQEG